MRAQQAQQPARQTRVQKHDVGVDRGSNAQTGAITFGDERDRALTTNDGREDLSCLALDRPDDDERDSAARAAVHAFSLPRGRAIRPIPLGSLPPYPPGWDSWRPHGVVSLARTGTRIRTVPARWKSKLSAISLPVTSGR
jgi:hypothetical protein